MDIAKLAAALAKAQGKIEGAVKDRKNDYFSSKYADLASVWDACRGPLSENGLSVVQFPCEAPPGHVGLITTLLHESGEYMTEKFFMPVKDSTNPQAVGSALTYARRYALSAAVGIAPEEDDGNAASAAPAKPQKVQGPPTVDYMGRFTSAQSLQERKAVANEVRSSALTEDQKVKLLGEFNRIIAEAQPKGVK
jgi:hypothetical protein